MTTSASVSLRAGAVLWLLIAACERPASSKLKDVQVPEGFTFQTSRSVVLGISAPAAMGSGTLEVARADGRLLYRGSLSSAPLKVRLGLPTGESALTATLVTADGKRHIKTFPVVSDTATLAFQ